MQADLRISSIIDRGRQQFCKSDRTSCAGLRVRNWCGRTGSSRFSEVMLPYGLSQYIPFFVLPKTIAKSIDIPQRNTEKHARSPSHRDIRKNKIGRSLPKQARDLRGYSVKDQTEDGSSLCLVLTAFSSEAL